MAATAEIAIGSSVVSRPLVLVGVASLAFIATTGYLKIIADAALDAPTVVLGLASAVLVVALFSMLAMVRSLAEINIAKRDEVKTSDVELREEKKRVLRAIKELDFDYEMGKLSKTDYASVNETFRLRALDIMRRLDGASKLHPELARDLETIAGERVDPDVGAPQSNPNVTDRDGTGRCDACGITNDSDARFCKGCGQEIET